MPFTHPPSVSDQLDEIWWVFIEDLWGLIKESPRCVLGDCGTFNIYRSLVRADWRNLWKWVENRVEQVATDLGIYVDGGFIGAHALIQLALDWLDVTWTSLGPQIMEGLYTAVSWAEAKANEIWDRAVARYDAARAWALNAWAWVRDKGNATWDWIRDKSFTVWAWINDKSGTVWDFFVAKAGILWDWYTTKRYGIEIWFDNARDALELWRTVYMPYYMALFDNYRDDLLDLLETGSIPSIPTLMLAQIEVWLYDRWFGEPAQ